MTKRNICLKAQSEFVQKPHVVTQSDRPLLCGTPKHKQQYRIRISNLLYLKP